MSNKQLKLFIEQIIKNEIQSFNLNEGKDLRKLMRLITPQDRVISLKTPLNLSVIDTQQHLYQKPSGLWYACGDGWIYFTQHDYKSARGNYFYKIKLSGNILYIKSDEDFKKFNDQYGFDLRSEKGYEINWPEVAKQYDGIEICPHNNTAKHRYPWYHYWDVASGCVWNSNTISHVEEIFTSEEEIEPDSLD